MNCRNRNLMAEDWQGDDACILIGRDRVGTWRLQQKQKFVRDGEVEVTASVWGVGVGWGKLLLWS